MQHYDLMQANSRLQNDITVQEEIYSPFYQFGFLYSKNNVSNPKINRNLQQIFNNSTQNSIKNQQFQHELEEQNNLQTNLKKDANLNKILTNKNQSNITNRQQQAQQILQQQYLKPYSFNYDSCISFQQTPQFKKSLLSPLTKFNSLHRNQIKQLYSAALTTQKFKQIHLRSNPLLMKDKPGGYFVGISYNLKGRGCMIQSLFFLHLAVYVQPFNQKIWYQYCDMLKKMGFLKKCSIIAKTAFLFCQKSIFGQMYLQNGQKSNTHVHQLRGLLSSLKQPQKHELIIQQSALIQLKYRKIWRGLVLLFNFCNQNNFKSSITQSAILLAKRFQSFQMKNLTLRILKLILKNKMPKYEVLNTYVQTVTRLYNSQIPNDQLNFIQNTIKSIGPQNRFRVYLQLAEINKNNSKLQTIYLQQAMKNVKKHIVQQICKKRSYRNIYLSILSMFSIQPQKRIMNAFKNDENLMFLVNKARFVRGEPLITFQFQDWKYYLHYALDKRQKILYNSYNSLNQGRILAQYFHVIRLKDSPLIMLKLWRTKIQQAPKSGQLWCEGGRIFLQLNQYPNAKKCFLTAIHFTPQYGDSFFQLLKILLIESCFLQIHQLYKNFLISEPFYGNVYSYIRLLRYQQSCVKLSHHQIWNQCRRNILQQIYSGKIKSQFLTAYEPYNSAFVGQKTAKIRQKLFMSYELISNKPNK